jgi:hypothetical protein
MLNALIRFTVCVIIDFSEASIIRRCATAVIQELSQLHVTRSGTFSVAAWFEPALHGPCDVYGPLVATWEVILQKSSVLFQDDESGTESKQIHYVVAHMNNLTSFMTFGVNAVPLHSYSQ